MATKLESLQAKIQKLQQQADAIKAERQRAVVQQIRELMLEYELTVMDIDDPSVWRARRAKGVAAASSAAGKLPPKYVNPKTGETWSGRARPPAWIKDVKDRSKFLINGQQGQPGPLNGVSAKALSLSMVKRPVAPKYRDPNSGLTWSGRGKPPAWIASAKDRSKFLINASGAASPAVTKPASTKGGATKKTNGAKKATTVKTATRKPSSRAAAKLKRNAATKPAEGNQAEGGEQSTQSAQPA